MSQTSLNFETQAGMKKAEDHANKVIPGWSDEAYDFVCEYIRESWQCNYRDERKLKLGEFMTEDVREASEGFVPEPPNKRAWGAVINRAAREGKIRKVGIRSVKNKTAHNANAAVWVRS